MYCKVCGKDLDEKDRFCRSCGAKITADDSEPVVEFTEEKGFVSDNSVIFEKEECADAGEEKGRIEAARNIYFDWDLGCFPEEKTVESGKVDFNWSSVVDEKKKESCIEHEIEGVFCEEDIYHGEPVSFDWGLGTTTRIDRDEMENAQQEAEAVTDVAELISESEAQSDEESTEEQEKRKIDKFYTFNKKNEEFQALLDQEYERLRKRIHEENEAEEALASKYEKLEKARHDWENTEIEPESEEASPQETENVLCDTEISAEPEEKTYPSLEQFFEDNSYTLEEGVFAIIQPIKTTSADVRAFNKASEVEVLPPKKNKIKYTDIFENDDLEEKKSERKKSFVSVDKNPPKKKSAKGKKIFFDVIIVILALIVILASILLFAKDSVPAAYITKGIDKVVSIFTGSEKPAEATVPSDVTTAMSAVIDAEMSKNANIGVVREGVNLGFSHDSDYGIEGFLNSKAFTDSVWFTDDSGNTVNYGNIIVGNIISYYSQLEDFRNGAGEDVLNLLVADSEIYNEVKNMQKAPEKGYDVTLLEFGEIRTMDNRYFTMVQVSEMNDKGEAESTSRKIVELVSEDKTMNIVSIKDI